VGAYDVANIKLYSGVNMKYLWIIPLFIVCLTIYPILFIAVVVLELITGPDFRDFNNYEGKNENNSN